MFQLLNELKMMWEEQQRDYEELENDFSDYALYTKATIAFIRDKENLSEEVKARLEELEQMW